MQGLASDPAPAPVPLRPDQAPSVCRIVLYRPLRREREGMGGAEAYPAVITRVWSPSCVNLHVLPDGGDAFFVTSRVLDPSGEAEGTWRWPARA